MQLQGFKIGFDWARWLERSAAGAAVVFGTTLGCGSSGNTPGSGGAGGSMITSGGGAGGSMMASGGVASAGGSGAGSAKAGSGGAFGGGASIGGNANAGSGGSAEPCTTAPPPPSALVGWASEGSGTTGAGDAAPIEVMNARDFSAMIAGTEPRVIHVSGNLTGSFEVGSNKTIVGVCDAEIHGHLGFNGSTNVIVRNLKIVGNNCTDSPLDCSGGADAVGITGGSNHLWFDHLDVSDGSDGNLDVTQGSDFVTVSWTKFSYSSRRTDPAAGASGHRFSNLIGASDTDVRDPGHLNVTYHHCWWAENIDQRMPRTRRGQIHVFNNLFTAVGNSYCTNAGVDAKLLVENNVYVAVNRPLDVSSGDMRAVGNVFQNTTGSATANGMGFVPPYTYEADATTGLEEAIRAGAGPH